MMPSKTDQSTIEGKKYIELIEMKELHDINPTLKEAWKEYCEIYNVISGKNNTLLDDIDRADLIYKTLCDVNQIIEKLFNDKKS